MRTAILLAPIAALASACATTGPATAPLATSAAAPIPPADLAAIGSTIDRVYSVISGPAGQERDWAAMRASFMPEARLQAITPKGLWGGSVDDYITRSGPLLVKSGFRETELSRRVRVYGNLANVWSSYHGKSDDGKIDIRGINSFELVRQPDGRWLVNSILWQQENPTIPLPADMEK